MKMQKMALIGLLSAVTLSTGFTIIMPFFQVEAQPVSQKSSQPSHFYATSRGIAIDGTDPVSYFRQGKPIAGKAEFSYSWGGVMWQFSSAENRQLFIANPDQYAPQYGGFCSWAVSNGYTAPTVPEAWQIVEGKLYLNFSPKVHQQWKEDVPTNISKANANWPAIQQGLTR